MKPISLLLLLAFSMIHFISSSFAQEWVHAGPYNAHVTALTVDPSDTSIVYAGTLARGIWKSMDCGQNWMELNDGFPVRTDTTFEPEDSWWDGDYVQTLMIVPHPTQTGKVWACPKDYGLLQSNDGGAHWFSVTGGLPHGGSVSELLILPETPDTMFLGLGSLYRSNDGGESWSLVEGASPGSITCIQVDPANSSHLFIGLYSDSYSLLESWDGGVTWEGLTHDYIFYKLVINPENSLNLFAHVQTGFFDYVIISSSDGGVNWAYYSEEGSYWGWVTEFYADAEWNLYVQEINDIVRSTDFGQTWNIIATDTPNSPSDYYPVRITANPSRGNSLYIGSRWGLYHSNDGGVNNYHSENGIDDSDFREIVTHPTSPDIAYAGGVGFWKTSDRGNSWQRLGTEAVGAIAIDKLHPDTLYWGSDYLKRSCDGGDTWQDIQGQIQGYVSAIEIHPENSNIIYCTTWAGSPGFYRSEDYGDTWELVDIAFNGSSSVRCIKVDESDPEIIYLGQRGLYKSEDSGLTWDQISSNWVKSLAFVPGSDTMYIASDGVQMSEDGGYNFEPISESLDTQLLLDIALSHENPQRVLMTTEQGIFSTQDNGVNWNHLDGPYNQRTYCLAFSSDQQTLHIGTNGYGIWSVTNPFTHVESNPDKSNIPSDFEILTVSPNPFNPSINIPVSLPNSSEISLSIYNILGQRIRVLHQGQLSAGIHSFTWNGKNDSGQQVSAGMYLLTMQTGLSTQAKKVVFLK